MEIPACTDNLCDGSGRECPSVIASIVVSITAIMNVHKIF